MNKKLIGFVILALVVGFVVGSFSKDSVFGAGNPNRFPNGYIDDGYGYYVNGVAVIDASKNITANSITVTTTSTMSGAAILSGSVKISSTASSTLQIGSTTSGVGTGCLVLGDSSGATSSPVYITATGTTISATTTKPAICR